MANDKHEVVIIDNKKPSLLISVRFLLAILAFLLTAIQYMQRINMSVAIVCMINNTHLEELANTQQAARLADKNSAVLNYTTSELITTIESDNTTYNQMNEKKCAFQKSTGKNRLDGPFNWDKSIQGLILSSFFYGYLFTQIAGAWLAIKFGPKIVLELSILIGSLFTLLTPIAARFSYIALFICRFIIGLAHGVVWPAMGSLWPYWAPPAERSTILGFASAGSQIGNVVTLPLGGFLCQYGFDGGWPSIFYIIGIVGVVWCILWFILVTNSPSQHKFITKREQKYIIDETKDSALNAKDKKNKRTPWIEILTSKAFYALLITHTCSNFGTYLFLTQLPTYMSEILNFDIKSNGGLSAIPYLSFWLFTILSGIVSDKIIQSGKASRKTVRKIFNTIGFLVPMTSMICLIFVTCQYPYIGVALVTIGLAFSGLTYGSGFLVNYNDVGGTFSGLVFGLSNTIGTISGIVAPYLVGLLTPNKLQKEWQIVFIITAIVYLVGALAFILLAEANTQEWATTKSTPVARNEDDDDVEENIKLTDK